MTPENALSFFLAIFIFGITLGPGLFAILARALLSSTSACLFLALGMVISDIIYLVLACYGLAALAKHWSTAFKLVRIVGASSARRFVRSERGQKTLNRTPGSLMIGARSYLASSG